MSENLSQVSEMSVSVEASDLLKRCAEPVRAGDSVKALIGRAARRTGLTYSRVKSLWYREARLVRAEEMDRMRAIAAKREGMINAGRRELRDLEERIRRLEALLDGPRPGDDRPRAG